MSEPEKTFIDHIREQIVFLEECVRGEHQDEVIDWPEIFHQLLTLCRDFEQLQAERDKLKEALERAHGELTKNPDWPETRREHEISEIIEQALKGE